MPSGRVVFSNFEVSNDLIDHNHTKGETGYFLRRGDTGIEWTDILDEEGPTTLVADCSIIPKVSVAYSLGTTTQRWKEIFVGQGSLNIAGPNPSKSGTIGTDENAIVYTKDGFATPFINIGASELTPGVVGGWRLDATGNTGDSTYDLIAQEVIVGATGLTGPVYSLIKRVGPTGPTGAKGDTGNARYYLQAHGDGTGEANFNAGSWITRKLNILDNNNITGATLSTTGSTIYLPIGIYLLEASAPAHGVDYHQIQLYNESTGTTVCYGTSELATDMGGGGGNNHVQTRSSLKHLLTVLTSTVYSIRHQCTKTNTGGMGQTGSNWGNIRFTEIYITQS